MKLDLLYEIDVPKPVAEPAPVRAARGRAAAYAEALEQIKLADKLGFHTTWHVEHHFREGRSHSPAPEVIIGALSQCTENLRLGLRRHADAARVHAADARRREGGDRRHPLRRAASSGAPAGRRRWSRPRSACRRDESRDQWEEAIQAVVQMWEEEYFEFHGKYLDFPRRMVTPKPVQDPHPPCWMAATSEGSAAVAGGLGLGLLSFSILQPLEKMAEHIRAVPRRGRQPRRRSRASPPTRSRRTRSCTAPSRWPSARSNGIWDSVWWWYKNLAEFTLEWEFPNLPQEERDKTFPLLQAPAGRATSTRTSSTTPT